MPYGPQFALILLAQLIQADTALIQQAHGMRQVLHENIMWGIMHNHPDTGCPVSLKGKALHRPVNSNLACLLAA